MIMPLCKLEKGANQCGWALWRIDEPLDELWQLSNPDTEAQFEYHQVHHPQKKLEWLASRLVIRQLVEQLGVSFQGIYKDAFGKPHLYKLPYHISIAHCFPYAAGAIHGNHSIGIDIERPREKLLHIKDRFLNPKEADCVGSDLEMLCKFWAGKEVMYKIYGRKKLIFKQHIEITAHLENPEKLNGRIQYQELTQTFDIQACKYDGHVIAHGNNRTIEHLNNRTIEQQSI